MTTFSIADWLVILLYVSTVVFLGVQAGKREKNSEDYFLGGRSMPWWAVMLSIYATSLSALTFIGVPGAAFAGDFNFLQLGVGDLVGRVLISYILLTAFYKSRVTSVYELLGMRFGPRSRDGGTLFFLATRLLASGVRLAGCAIALSVVFQIDINLTIVFIVIAAVGYTLTGGIKAVIWTDVLQFGLLLGAGVIALITIFSLLPGGFSEFISIGQEYHKFKIFHISFDPASTDYIFDLSNSKGFLPGFIFGCLTTFAALGTDQDLVQRMLTCKKVNEGQRALLWTAVLNFPITLLFLSVGAALFAFYKVFPDDQVSNFMVLKQADKIFPHFIKTVLTSGFKGVLVAGILSAAMSSLDSALNALATSSYIDIVKRYFRPQDSQLDSIRVSRYLVAMFALILASIAIWCTRTESILWLGFRIVGYTYGAMLGIFLLATITKKRGHDMMNLLTMISSVFVVVLLTSSYFASLVGFSIAWPWAIVIGTVWVFGLGLLFPSSKGLPKLDD